MGNLPSISVVLPAYRAGRTLASAIDSLLAERYPGRLEIVVVRTGQDDGADAVVRERSRVKLVTRPERAFAGAARNLGAARASGEIVAFLDADCAVQPGWIRAIAKAAELGTRAQGGAIETRPPKTLGACAEEFLETLEFHPRGRARPLHFASAANCAYDTELFHATGGFPDVKLGEDLLLGQELRRRGVPIAFNPEMGVLHDNAVPLARFLAKQREHGVYSARVRHAAAGLHGSLFARQPLLLPLLAPVRLLRLCARAAAISPSLLPALFALSPLVTLGVASWTLGFAKEVSAHAD